MLDTISLIDTLVDIDHLPVRIANILKEKHFSSEDEFYQYYEKLLLSYTSFYLFHGQLIDFYPIIKERTATKDFSCHLSGVKIKQGSPYITYHPFVENLENKRVYVTKREIKSLPEFSYDLPKDIFAYEDWYVKLKNCYQYEMTNGGGVDFYNLSVECGNSCLDLYPLNLSRKRKK